MRLELYFLENVMSDSTRQAVDAFNADVESTEAALRAAEQRLYFARNAKEPDADELAAAAQDLPRAKLAALRAQVALLEKLPDVAALAEADRLRAEQAAKAERDQCEAEIRDGLRKLGFTMFDETGSWVKPQADAIIAANTRLAPLIQRYARIRQYSPDIGALVAESRNQLTTAKENLSAAINNLAGMTPQRQRRVPVSMGYGGQKW